MKTTGELSEAKDAAVEAHRRAENETLGLVRAVVRQHRAPTGYPAHDADTMKRLLDQLSAAEDARDKAFEAMQAARQALIDALEGKAA